MKNNLLKTYRKLESDTLNYFNNMKFGLKVFALYEEIVEEQDCADILTYRHSYSGENIDFYPLRIYQNGIISAVNTNYESIQDFNFSDCTLLSQIELINLIEEKE